MEKQFDLSGRILAYRPNLKENSLRMYLSMLGTLNKKNEITSLRYLFNIKEIFKIMNNYKLRTKRNYLTAILVALGIYDNAEYNELREKYRKELELSTIEMEKEIQLHKKTEKENENWTTLAELKKSVLNKWRRDIKRRHMTNGTVDEPTNEEILFFQKYLVAALYLLRPVVRLDYAPMKIIYNRNDIVKGNNYLLVISDRTKYFIFQDYKTFQKYGSLEFKVETPINNILHVWINFYNKTDYLLLNKRMTPLSSNGLGKLITDTFSTSSKIITLNLLRHISISELVDLDKRLKEERLASMMMHSLDVQKDYIKI